ncbi:MAG TPA: host attachment protein [Spongiibacteraceae bacterium]|nr:host attachment protein [Spongiibacteraceae bacterium]
MTSWVVVADSRRARIFANEGAHFSLREVADFAHPLESLHGGNPKGHISAGSSGTSHGMEPATLPKEKSRHAFAHEIANYLQQEFAQKHFSKLILVAAPEFLGEVRAALPDKLGSVVSGSVAKDLVACTQGDISKYLDAQSSLH